MCKECYADDSRASPLLDPLSCLQNHTQYICGTCGRCICIERDPKRGSQRWNFPFKTLEIARLYLRTADFTMKRSCGIYELEDISGRVCCKIFADDDALKQYIAKNKHKVCRAMKPVYTAGAYKEYPDTQVRRLTADEIEKYMSERAKQSKGE